MSYKSRFYAHLCIKTCFDVDILHGRFCATRYIVWNDPTAFLHVYSLQHLMWKVTAGQLVQGHY